MKNQTSKSFMRSAYVLALLATFLTGSITFYGVGPFGLAPIATAILAVTSAIIAFVLYELSMKSTEKTSN